MLATRDDQRRVALAVEPQVPAGANAPTICVLKEVSLRAINALAGCAFLDDLACCLSV